MGCDTVLIARFESARRTGGWEYPKSSIREALVNALVLRDHSIAGTDIMSTIYTDCLEIQSLGQLPDPVMVEGTQAVCAMPVTRF